MACKPPSTTFFPAEFTPTNAVRGLASPISSPQVSIGKGAATHKRNLPDFVPTGPRADRYRQTRVPSTCANRDTRSTFATSFKTVDSITPLRQQPQNPQPFLNIKPLQPPSRLGRYQMRHPHPDMMPVPCFCQDLPRAFWEATDRLPEPNEINLGWRVWQELVFSIQTTRCAQHPNLTRLCLEVRMMRKQADQRSQVGRDRER